jgi:ATP-dependent DNA helicase RecG
VTRRTIPTEESLTVEFKSDVDGLPDGDLVLAVVCLANTDGGDLYLGVEDDGRVTGLHPRHQNVSTLAALIANRTSPPLSVRVTAFDEGGVRIARIEVPKSHRLVANTQGTLQRRRLKIDGKPECVPLLPGEFLTRQADLGAVDHSSLPVTEADADALDPLERQRLRAMIDRYKGDQQLIGLDDEQLDGALQLTVRHESRVYPTVAGLLLIGRETALRRHLPTHEVAFQVLDGADVKLNEFYRYPLLRTFERVEELFSARNEENEVQVGLFRVAVPTVDREAFREAIVNALVHRDYARMGAVLVQWNRDDLVISNPGGFVEGITLENLLVVPPRPRNPVLADAFKRIGLAERTGRGVDKIYGGMLRYGRPVPDYRQSDATAVVVRLSHPSADIPFLQLIVEEERRSGTPLAVDSLLVLSELRENRRASIVDLASAMQRDEAAARRTVERLVEAGLVEPHGQTRGRTYTLSASAYRALGAKSAYVRQVGFEALQQEQMVTLARKHGSVRRSDVIDLCRIAPKQATRLLAKLVRDGHLEMSGTRKAAVYAPRSPQKAPRSS